MVSRAVLSNGWLIYFLDFVFIFLKVLDLRMHNRAGLVWKTCSESLKSIGPMLPKEGDEGRYSFLAGFCIDECL